MNICGLNPLLDIVYIVPIGVYIRPSPISLDNKKRRARGDGNPEPGPFVVPKVTSLCCRLIIIISIIHSVGLGQ